jgi:hypothetical protein
VDNQELSSSDERILKNLFGERFNTRNFRKEKNDFGGIFWISRIPASIPGWR